MKRIFYLPALTNDMIDRLRNGILSYFKFCIFVSYDKKAEILVIDKSVICSPIDETQWDRISAYVNGFMQAVS